MSKKITHEQAREGLLQVYVYNDIHTNEANYVLIRDYIAQQEEQEKLLELYRELNNKILYTYDIFERMTNKEWAKFVNLQQQIKELENDKIYNSK